MRIFLTGMMGSGKSFWAKKIAAAHHMPYADLDDLIQQQESCPINDIFEKFGEAYFRKAEQESLHEIIHTNDHIIVATGGGTPCYFDNLQKMKLSGKLIYLRTPVSVLADRIMQDSEHRPLLRYSSKEQLIAELETILNSRKNIYEQSDVIIDMNQTDETNFALNFFRNYV